MLTAKYNFSPTRRGFTLVELLIVVAVLAVLLAMLMPAISRARASAQSLQCASQLRAIGQGFAVYRANYGGWLPPLNSEGPRVPSNEQYIATDKPYGMWQAIGPYVGQPEWGGLLTPPTSEDNPRYEKFGSYWGKKSTVDRFNSSVWACPLIRKTSGATPWNVGYAESLYLTTPGGWLDNNKHKWHKARPVSAIRQPSTKVHVSESTDWHLGDLDKVGVPNTGTGEYTWDIYRHYGGCSVLFVDGHVAFYSGKSIVKDITRSPTSTTSLDNFNLP